MDDILGTIRLLSFSGVLIFYYYQLYRSNIIAKIFMVFEVVIRSILLFAYMNEGGESIFLAYIFFAPIILSVVLALTKGKLAKMIFIILVSLVVIGTMYLMSMFHFLMFL